MAPAYAFRTLCSRRDIEHCDYKRVEIPLQEPHGPKPGQDRPEVPRCGRLDHRTALARARDGCVAAT